MPACGGGNDDDDDDDILRTNRPSRATRDRDEAASDGAPMFDDPTNEPDLRADEARRGPNRDDEDGDLLADLAGLRPADPALDAGEALFEAGRRAGERAARRAAGRQLFAWRAAAAVLLAAGGLAVAARPTPTVVEVTRVVYADPPATTQPAAPVRPPVDVPAVTPASPSPASPPALAASPLPAATADVAADPVGRLPWPAPFGGGQRDSLLALRWAGLDRSVDRLPPAEPGWVSAVRVRGLAMPF